MNKSTNEKERLDTIPPVHTLIDSAIRSSKPVNVSLHEIAERCGFKGSSSKTASPTMSMLRSGSMRLPMNKIIVVADELGIDRRKLFTSQLRDSIFNLIVKVDIPSVPRTGTQTAEEKLNHESAIITRAAQKREFASTWASISELISNTHSPKEAPLIKALREVEEELGQDISLDSVMVEQFKNMVRDQYAL